MLNVVVGVVVMILGVVLLCVSNLKWRFCLVECLCNVMEWYVWWGMGGVFLVVVCNFVLVVSWELEVLWNFSMEKCWCLLELLGRVREMEV